MLDNITALSPAGSRLATENVQGAGDAVQTMADRMREVTDQWREHGFDIEMTDLWYAGDRNDVVDYLDGARLGDLCHRCLGISCGLWPFVAGGFHRPDDHAWVATVRHRYPELDAAWSSPSPSAVSNALIIHSLIAAANVARFSRLMMPCPSLPKSR